MKLWSKKVRRFTDKELGERKRRKEGKRSKEEEKEGEERKGKEGDIVVYRVQKGFGERKGINGAGRIKGKKLKKEGMEGKER